jgi:steroid delta-isomerase-like uncharacterized protein
MTREEIERLDDAGMDAWDKHDPDAFMSLFADKFTWLDDTSPDPIRSSDAGKEYMRSWFTAFPDMRVRTTNRVVGDDSIACELEFTGTNTGTLAMGGMEMPATGKSITGHGCYFARAENGKIIEFHSHPDAAGMMAQLGLMGAGA